MAIAQRFGEGHRLLVSGGAGFVASHLVDALVARGATVVAVDNFLTGSEENLAHVTDHPRFTLVKHDLCDELPAHHPALTGRFDAILHLASPASPTDFTTLPIEILRVGSLGTLHLLDRAVADRARFLLASTSEAYGDPLVHPQPESYWGNVNPVGVRSVYDEAKRFAEAATMAYRRTHGLDTAIVRIFNSILADELVLFDDGRELRHESVQSLAERIGANAALTDATVPAFGEGGSVMSSEASWLIGHPTSAPCYRVTTSYGRSIAVTGDHSLFTRSATSGEPEARPVNHLRAGDYVAISSRVDVVERDRKRVSLLDVLLADGTDLWEVAVSWPGLGDTIQQHRRELVGVIASRLGTSRQSAWGSLYRWRDAESAPLLALQRVGIAVHPEATIRRYAAGAKSALPVHIDMTNDLLWLLGLFVAEGCLVDDRPAKKNAYVNISCDETTLDRAEAVFREAFGLHVVRAAASPEHGPAIYVHSQLLIDLWRHIGLAKPEKSIPGWILGLPLARLKWFMEGYREGDGVHSGAKFAAGIRHEFSTTSRALKDDLVVAFARFGLVASVGRYETTFTQKTGDRRYPFWRLTLSNVDPWSPLSWDTGVRQKLTARRYGDLVWAKVKSIDEIPDTPLVYDFCVPGKENFWAGNGVMAHNTYGPRMKPGDGRAIPTFISQALRGEPVTVHGTGEQTRAICYVADLVRGILLLLDSTEPGPINCGTEHELSMRELAERIVALTGSRSAIVHTERTADDPEMRRPDLTLARTRLGYAPAVDPDEGLRRTILYFRDRLS